MNSVEIKVCQIIANALYLDPSDVSLESNLLRELGAESIDLLDIVFRLENEFSIKIPRGELESGFMLRDFASLFTVASFVRIIEEQFSPKAKSSHTHIPNIEPVVARRGSVIPAVIGVPRVH